MSVKNQLISCAKKSGNTGFGNCVVDIGFIRGIIFAPDNFKIPASSVAAAVAAIQAGIINDVPANRLYPVGGFVAPTDSSETLPVVTYADGSKAVSRDIFYDWTFQFGQGKFCLNYRLRMQNGLNKSFFFYDKSGRIYGTDTGDGNVTAIKPNLAWTNAFKLNTGAAPTEYSTMVNFDATLINDYPAFIDFSNSGGYPFFKGLSGLQDVDIFKVTRATNVVTVSALTDCASANLGTLYPSLLANSALWNLFADNNGMPGNAIDVTSVAYVANSNSFAITANASDPDYQAALAAPGTPTLTGSTTGGTLAATTYYIKQTALNQYGETIGSTEASVTTTGSTSSIAITNAAVTGATSYKTYIGVAAGAETAYFATATPNLTITTAAGTAGTVPTANTTYGPIWVSLAGPAETFPILLTGYESAPVSVSV